MSIGVDVRVEHPHPERLDGRRDTACVWIEEDMPASVHFETDSVWPRAVVEKNEASAMPTSTCLE